MNAVEKATKVLDEHLPESYGDTGCALRCGWSDEGTTDSAGEHLAQALADAGLLADIAAAREADRAEVERLRAERDRLAGTIARQLGECIGCTTEPEETCPIHGRTYTEWVEIASEVIGRHNDTEARAESAEAALAGHLSEMRGGLSPRAKQSLKEGAYWVRLSRRAALILLDADLRAIIPADATTALDAVKAQAAREALLAAADDYERERIERHEIVIAALDALTTLITDVYTSHPLDIARVILASDWLAAHDAEVARTAAKEAGERIAQAIENYLAYYADVMTPSERKGVRDAARIAREEGRADVRM